MTNNDDDIRNKILEEISAIGGRVKPAPILKRDGPRDGNHRIKYSPRKIALTARLNPAAINQFKALAMDLQMTQESVIAEALNLLFQKYGQPPIA